MSIDITLYEDTGPVVSGHGTTRSIVNNIGWRSNGTPDLSSCDYVFAPIVHSPDGSLASYSFKKYNYMKISGTYAIGSRPRIKISGNINGEPFTGYDGSTFDIKLFYKLSSVYEEPNANWDGDMMFITPGETKILYPKLSTVGPETSAGYPQYLSANTTYYSEYLITQLVLPASDTVGNIGELNIEWYVDEYEDGNV